MYKNPRIKHVKKIMEVADAVSYLGYSVIAKTIVDQCNLLLETKKKKKFFVGVDLGSKDGDCTVFGYRDNKGIIHITRTKYSKPSPQPEIIKLDLMQVAHEANILGEDIESEIRDKTEEKINEVIDQLNKLTKTK